MKQRRRDLVFLLAAYIVVAFAVLGAWGRRHYSSKSLRLLESFRKLQQVSQEAGGSTGNNDNLYLALQAVSPNSNPEAPLSDIKVADPDKGFKLTTTQMTIIGGVIAGAGVVLIAVGIAVQIRRRVKASAKTALGETTRKRPTTTSSQDKGGKDSLGKTGRLQGERANRIVSGEDSVSDPGRPDSMRNTRGEFFTLTEIDLATPRGTKGAAVTHHTPR